MKFNEIAEKLQMAQKQISFVIYLYDKNNIEESIKKTYVYSGKILV